MNIDLDALEAAAKAATPGPWEDLSEHPDHLRGTINKGAKHIAGCSWFETPREEQCVTVKEALANAAYIAAANPAVVLEMIAELRKRDKAMQRLARHLNWTTETPTEPGWYWYRGGGVISILSVNQLFLEILKNRDSNIEFAGPIPEPQEPK